MTTMDAGLLILRIVVGVALLGHGTQKLFGWFGGHGRRDTGAFFELLGYRPGVLFAVIAGLSEAGGGTLLALGFLTPLAGAAIVGVMLNAASALRGRGPWVTNGGWEYPVVLATVGASIALTGPGSASVDNALGLDWSTGWGVAGVALGVGAALATILVPRLRAQSAQTDAPVEPVGEVG
jgi:putative oxidoreductase